MRENKKAVLVYLHMGEISQIHSKAINELNALYKEKNCYPDGTDEFQNLIETIHDQVSIIEKMEKAAGDYISGDDGSASEGVMSPYFIAAIFLFLSVQALIKIYDFFKLAAQ